MTIKINEVNRELVDKISSLLEAHKKLNIKINHFNEPLNFVLEKHFNETDKLIIKKFGDKDLGTGAELGIIEFIGRFCFMESGINCDIDIETFDI